MTIHLLDDFSGCLVENPSCSFAERLGFSYLCHHPKRLEFSPDTVLPEERERRSRLYQALRDKRRDWYILKHGLSPEEMVKRLKDPQIRSDKAQSQSRMKADLLMLGKYLQTFSLPGGSHGA